MKDIETKRWAGALPLLLVALGALLLFGPMLLGGRALFWGTPLLQFVPWREFALETLVQGRMPLWNPQVGMGAPLLANYQTALLYPPNWILPITGIAWGQGLLVMLHLIWAGCGMALLAKRLGTSLLGQSLAGLAFGLSGYLVARAGFLSINAAAAWLPWLVLCGERLVQEKGDWRCRLRMVIWLALALTMQWLAGHAQTAWYSLVLLGLWVLWRAVGEGGWRALVGVIPWVFAAGILAFALSAGQLVPTLEYMLQSQRADALDPEFAMTYSFAPWRALGLLLPDLQGNPAHGDFWGYGNYWEDALYTGVIPLLFTVLALVRGFAGREPRKRLICFLGLVSGITFLLALGKNTPIFPWLFEHVPTFDLFQAPARWNLLLVFGLALLAGFGADAWSKPDGRSLYWMRLATAGASMAALAPLLLGILAPEVEPTFTRAFGLAGLWLLVFCVIALLRPARLSWAWSAALGLVVVLDLVIAHWGLNPSLPVSLYEDRSALVDRIGTEHRMYMPPELEQELKFERTHRFDTFQPQIDWFMVRDTGLPNAAMLDGIPSANNFDPLLSARFDTWMRALEELPGERQEALLGLMDVGWLAQEDAAQPTGVGFAPVEGAQRARLIYDASWVQAPEQALAHVLDPSFDSARTVVLEGTGADQHGDGTGEIERVVQVHPGRVEIETVSSAEGWIVLSDAWYPGWRAEVDGFESDILRADYLFRAVRVPEGEHLIAFSYEPVSARVGFMLSGLGWVILGGLLWLSRD